MSHWDLCPQGLTRVGERTGSTEPGPVQEQKRRPTQRQKQPDGEEEDRRGPPRWVFKEKGNLLDG